jgi:flagellar export protein FliJ
MSWAQSLIRIHTFEVEELQKRLKEIEDRRAACELTLDALDLEAEEEKLRAKVDPNVAWCHPDYVKAWKLRRARSESELQSITMEAEGARDALAIAFEEQKKVEHVAELARIAEAKEMAKRENAALDEIALRQSLKKAGG